MRISYLQIKSRYQGSVLGILWAFVNPMILTGAQAFFFSKVLKVNLPFKNFFLFLASGTLTWIYISQTLDMSANTLIHRGKIIKSAWVPPTLLVESVVLENAFNYLVGLLLVLLLGSVVGDIPTFSPSGLVISTLSLTSLLLATAKLTSLLNSFYRDFRFIMNFLMQVLFYVSPVIYPVLFVPEHYRWLIYANPFAIHINWIKSSIGMDEKLTLAPEMSLVWTLLLYTFSLPIWNRWKARAIELI